MTPSHPSLSLTLKAAHAAWWSFLEVGTRYLVQFGLMVALARLLTPSDFGVMAILLALTSFSALLVEGGMGSALIQRQTTSANEETSVFWVNLGLGSALALLLWSLAPLIAGFYAQPLLVPLLEVFLWVLPLGALATVPNAVLSQRLDFRSRAIAELFASLGSGVLALWLALEGFGVWCLVWQPIAGGLIRACVLWRLSDWRPRGQFDGDAFLRLFRFGGWLLLANALNLIAVRLQALLIGKLFDARTLGLYAMAQDTQQAPAQFMSSLLNRVGLPMFSSVACQPAKLAGALSLALRLSMFVFAPFMASIAVVAQPLILLLYGPQWVEVAPLMAVLALGALFWPLHVLNLAALGALGRPDLVLQMEIAKGLISIPLVWVAAFFGVQVLAWAVLATSFVCVLINTWYSQRLFGCGLRSQLRDITPILLATLLSSAAAWLSLGWTGKPWLDLVVAVSIAAIVYIAVAVAFRMEAWRDMLNFMRTLRAGRPPSRQGSCP